MVAPVNLKKSSRYLVRIPGASAPVPVNTSRKRSLSLHQEKPHQGTDDTDTTTTTSNTSTTTTATATTTCVPFRSLRSRRQGNAGSARQSVAGPVRDNKRKAYELEPQDDPEMERCRLNAINARKNRELKKARLADLEKRLEERDRERDRLLGENRELKEGMARLQRQVGHLTSVLRNDSRLSTILGKLASASGSRSSRQVGGGLP